MTEVEMVTVSSRGQIAIPAEVRDRMELEKGSKLLVVSEGDTVLLRKIDESAMEASLEEILKPMWAEAEETEMETEDVEELVHESRGVEE
jgi:AbrB family looped-hinge helix DNA binding protein